jgi:alpha-glucosidase
MRWVHASDDALVYLRETADQAVLVHCARAAHEPITISNRHLPGVQAAVPAYGGDLEHGDRTITLEAHCPQVSIWSYLLT